MLAAEVCHRVQRRPIAIASVLAIVSVAWLFLLPAETPFPRWAALGIPATLLVWSVATLEPIFHDRIPPLLLFLGAASYAIYLFHPLIAPAGVIVASKLGLTNGYAAVALCWAIGIGVGSVVYRFVEPKLKLPKLPCCPQWFTR
jgi:peptidoglycan/LPS O-acetylase OafA/YrhL